MKMIMLVALILTVLITAGCSSLAKTEIKPIVSMADTESTSGAPVNTHGETMVDIPQGMVTVVTDTEILKVEVEGFPDIGEGWSLYGLTVHITNVYPGYSGSAPITIVNGNDYARTFHLSLQQGGRELESYYKSLVVAYEQLIKQYDDSDYNPFGEYSSLQSVCRIIEEEANKVKPQYEYTPPAKWMYLLSTSGVFDAAYKNFGKTMLAQYLMVTNPPMYEMLSFKFERVNDIYKDLKLDYEKYLEKGYEPFPKEYFDWISIEDMQPKVPISGVKKVSVTLSAPFEFPDEMKGHKYDLRILVEDWSQTEFIQVAWQEKWLIEFA